MYPTPEDLRKFSKVPQVKSETNDSELQSVIDYAIMRVETYARQSFLSTEETIRVDGTDTSILSLPRRIYKLDSLFIDGVNFINSVVFSDDNFQLKLQENPYSIMDENYSRTVFTKGFNNVIIDGCFGWEEVPQDVIFCINRLAEAFYLFRGDRESIVAESGIYKKQTISGYSYELKDTRDMLPTESTGNPSCDVLLKKYQRTEKKKSRLKIGTA